MDPAARKSRKGGRGFARPFYATDGQTSAEIVSEARQNVRTVETKRPFTPVEQTRTLFGVTGSTAPVKERPASSFSLGHYQYEGEPSRPPSGRRLTPLEKAPNIPEDAVLPIPPPTPPGKGRRPLRSSLPGPGPSDSELTCAMQPQAPVLGNQADSTKKLKSALIGQDSDARIAVCPSPQKRYSPSSTPPAFAGLVRWNSAEVIPTPPSAIRADIMSMRRVRSGPKERNPPVNCEVTPRVKSGPVERSSHQSESNSPKSESGTKVSERTGSGDKRKKKSANANYGTQKTSREELSVYYEDNVKPLLAQMEEKLAERNSSELCQDCLKLWNVLERKGMIGRASGSSSARRRGEILRTVFKFLDIHDPRLLLRLARLVLSMKVTGNNLTNICKVVYRVAKTEKNDQLFLEEDMLRCLVDTIKGADISTTHEALVYATGALKFLSNSNAIAQKELVSCGGIGDLASVLKNIATDVIAFSQQQSVEISSLLVQITAILRNLADVTGAREIFISHKVVSSLVELLGPFLSDQELVWNCSRILSKLTLYTDCCNELCSVGSCFGTLLGIINEHEKIQEVVVRVCFILGNLTAKNDEARYKLFFTSKAMDTLLSVMQTYFDLEMDNLNAGTNENGQINGDTKAPSKCEDVLIKAIRVVANFSIHHEAGPAIAASQEFIDFLIQILDEKPVCASEELILNTVATLNNLSFYTDGKNIVQQKQLEITELLIPLLMPDNMDAMVEASRVFGNFSRSKDVRLLLHEHKVDEIMIALLDAGERETVFTACGVLINMMTDEDIRCKLHEEGGIRKLIDVLRDFGKNDWQLSSMVCQTLWNYSDKITSSVSTFGEQETVELIEILTDYLDEEVAFDPEELPVEEGDLHVVVKDMWESQFVPVGQHLLRRIKAHHTDLVPLEAPV